MSTRKSKQPRLKVAARWLGAAIAIPLVAIGVQRAVALISSAVSPSVPSTSDQIVAIENAAERAGYRMIQLHVAHLQGPGSPSYILALRSKATDKENFGASRADQLRIYDLASDGDLQLAFQLMPRKNPADPMRNLSRLVTSVSVHDYSGSGIPQVLATYSDVGPEGWLHPYPLLIAWRPERDRFMTYPLIDAAPRIASDGGASGYGRVVQQDYRAPAEFVDRMSGTTVRAFPAGERMVTKMIDHKLYVISGYVLTAHFANEFHGIEAIVSAPDFQYSAPFSLPCLSRVIRARRAIPGILAIEAVLRNAFSDAEMQDHCASS